MWCIVSSSTWSLRRRAAAAPPATAGPRARSNGRRGLLAGQRERRASRRSSGRADRSHHGQRERPRRPDRPAPAARPPRAKTRAQHLVAAHDLAQAARQRRRRPAAPQARSADGHVVERRCPAPADRGTRAAAGRTTAAERPVRGTGIDRRRRGAHRPRSAASIRCRPDPPPSAPRTASRSGSSTPKRVAHPRHRPGSPAASARRVRRSRRARPTRSTPSTSAQIPASSSSIGVRGATYPVRPAAAPRRRQGLPVHLAVGRQRQRLQHHERGGHHVLRQPIPAGRLPQRPSAATRRPRHHIGDQPLVTRIVLARHHHRLPHPGMRPQHRLDLAQLDPEAAHLHLVVDAAQELQLAVRRQRARSPVR